MYFGNFFVVLVEFKVNTIRYREDAQETVTLLEENVKDLEEEKEKLTGQLQGALEARKEQDKVRFTRKLLRVIHQLKDKIWSALCDGSRQ